MLQQPIVGIVVQIHGDNDERMERLRMTFTANEKRQDEIFSLLKHGETWFS